MNIQPREELLRIWKNAAQVSYFKDRGEKWPEIGRRGRNSISDAEQLLCFMLPATRVRLLRLDQPDLTRKDAAAALAGLGSPSEIPRVLMDAVITYLIRYERDGTPVFGGGKAFDDPKDGKPPTDEQLEFDVVESFVVSIQLTLAALGFAKEYANAHPILQSEDEARIEKLNELASRRLSAAMIGLLRSYVISVYDEEQPPARRLLEMVSRGHDPQAMFSQLKLQLRDVAQRLDKLDIGIPPPEGLNDRNKIFECGWTWGIAKEAPVIPFTGHEGEQRPGYAIVAPFLYFTVVALDGIAELDTDRTRQLGLLTNDQLNLANALKLRWELTQVYWSKVATFSGTVGGRWALEDIPWRTTDDEETDLYSLLVTTISARDLAVVRGTDADLDRLGRILEELANRGRITRRAGKDDASAISLHAPGHELTLEGSEIAGTSPLTWALTDYAPSLLKHTLNVASKVTDAHIRTRLLRLSDQIWNHIQRRRISDSSGVVGPGLWDQPAQIFPEAFEYRQASWHHTLRVIEGLLIATDMFDRPPLRGARLQSIAEELLAEAEHMLDNERLNQPPSTNPGTRRSITEIHTGIERAWQILADRPGSAIAHASKALVELDRLLASRDQGAGRQE